MLRELIKDFTGEILYNEPLSRHTSYKIGGKISYLAYPESINDLFLLSHFLKNSKLPYSVLGAGSNVLASDEDYVGVIIKTKKVNPFLREEENQIWVGAGLGVSDFILEAKKKYWKNFVRLCGIPGNMGGVLAMNGGTHLGEIAELVISVDVYSLKEETAKTYGQEEIKYSYRSNNFLQPHEIIVGALLRKDISLNDNSGEYTEFLKRRKATQPLRYPSCGSVFKNPEGFQAWKLIEDAGLKGAQIGDAQISEIHSNWIVNMGQATACDVYQLIELAREKVFHSFGIKLEPEVKQLHFLTL